VRLRSWLSWCACCWLWSALAFAQPSGVISVQVVGALGQDGVLRQRIASWFDADSFQVKVEPAARLDTRGVLAPEHGALVKVWVTRKSDKLARLYFATTSSDTGQVRYLIRDLELERGLDEVGAEEIAQTVHLSALALLEGQLESSREEVERALSTEPEPPAPPAPTTAPPADPAPEHSTVEPEQRRAVNQSKHAPTVELYPAVGYAVEFRADEGMAHGPRGRLQLAFPSGFGLWSRVHVTLPHTEELSGLDLELGGGSVLLAASYRKQVSDSVALSGYAGASLELVQYRASAVPGVTFTSSGAESELRPRAVLGMLAAFGKWPRLGVVTELGLAFHRTDYEAARGTSRRVVAEAARLVPALGLELEF
jgi:hypothetical protein